MNISPVAGYMPVKNHNRIATVYHTDTIENVSEQNYSRTCAAKNQYTSQIPLGLNFKGSIPEASDGIKALYELTQSENAQQFVAHLLENPSQSKQKVRELLSTQNIGAPKEQRAFLQWLTSSKGYYGEYSKYVRNYFREATSIEDLLKFQPNWAPWELERKAFLLTHPELNEEGDITQRLALRSQYKLEREFNFQIGELPEIFPKPETYETLITKLKAGDSRQSISLDGKTYSLKKLKGGDFNDKFIYLLEAEDKKYILKFDRINVEDAHSINGRELSLHEKRAIRGRKYLAPDSIYLNACVSKYLELNGCNDMQKLVYYDHKTHSEIFEYLEGTQSSGQEQSQSISDIQSKMNSLGIYLNDTAEGNSITTESGEKVIDLGHCNYMDLLKPGLKEYNIQLPNSNGTSIESLFASMLLILWGCV